MVTDEIRQSLIAIPRHYMDKIIYGIRQETIDVEVIDRVFDACEDLLRTPPNDDHEGLGCIASNVRGQWTSTLRNMFD